MVGVARLPMLVVMNREVEIDTRQAVINSMDGSSLPGWFDIRQLDTLRFFSNFLVFLPAALKASFVRAVAAAKSRIGSTNAEIENFFITKNPLIVRGQTKVAKGKKMPFSSSNFFFT